MRSLLLSSSSLLAAVSIHASLTAGIPAEAMAAAADADQYWTSERLRGATAASDSDGPVVARSLAALALAPSKEFNGVPSLGAIFYSGTENHFCSASVVKSPNKNLIITAAHCLTSKKNANLVFIPQYHDGQKPFGVFPITPGHIYIDKRYEEQGEVKGDDWDFAFAGVGPNSAGQQIEEVVGGNKLWVNPDYEHKIQLIGYPKDDSRPLTCTSNTVKFKDFLQVDCDGYKSGTSGSPWLANFNGQTGDIVCVLGGYQTGGESDNTSYCSYFDDDVKKLYDRAVANHPKQAYKALPSGSTMRHSQALTSGYFTRDNKDQHDYTDMIVVWVDGEVSLYRGDERSTFDQEITLAKPNGTWKNAISITAGNFTGSETNDLIVRWVDGELTLYPDVDENGFHGEIQLMAPNSLWKNATRITAGRFASNDARRNDLIVQWVDGEVTLYSNVEGAGLHGEKQLLAPNGTWTNARAITSGDFTGAGTSDLIVRWVDGELTLYPDVDENGFHGEIMMKSPNGTWRNATLITGGNYTDNHRTDDLVVRWVDGEVSLYPDVDGGGLHREETLVQP